MFSGFIQNLLNTGGETQAMQRYAQINNRVNNLNPQQPQNPLDTIYPQNKFTKTTPFEEVLQSSAKSNFGTLLLDPRLKQVNANIITQTPQISLQQALTEATAVQENTQQAYKALILNVVSQISKKHGVD